MRIRPERVAHLMQREIVDILRNEVRDPRVSEWVGVTEVEVTQDLAFARVFVTILQDGEERERTLQALGSAAGFVRRQLAPRLGLREVPEIRFVLDDSVERGARVDEILRRLRDGERIDDAEGGA